MMKRKVNHLSSTREEERTAKRSREERTNGEHPILLSLLRIPETSPQDIEAFYNFTGIKSTDNEISKPFPPERKEEILRLKLYAQMDRACDSFSLRSGGPRFFDRRQDEHRIAEEFGYVPRTCFQGSTIFFSGPSSIDTVLICKDCLEINVKYPCKIKL